ncbi:hypothetical protein BDR06DRAFT_977039 [Suillus hirtellus]|nr:hypothetical protein BDR06DRAFT_977039 [Suillus hirtellus]
MLSAAPTHQALTQLINNGPDVAPSQHQRHDCCPPERALYQAEEEQDRNVCQQNRQNGQHKIKVLHKKIVDEVFISNYQPDKWQCLGQWPAGFEAPPGGWWDDALTKDSEFLNCGHMSNDNSVPSTPCKLMMAQAKELMHLRQAQSAVTTQGNSDNDLDKSNGKQNHGNNYEDCNNEDYMDYNDVFMDRDGEDNAHCNGCVHWPAKPGLPDTSRCTYIQDRLTM